MDEFCNPQIGFLVVNKVLQVHFFNPSIKVDVKQNLQKKTFFAIINIKKSYKLVLNIVTSVNCCNAYLVATEMASERLGCAGF